MLTTRYFPGVGHLPALGRRRALVLRERDAARRSLRIVEARISYYHGLARGDVAQLGERRVRNAKVGSSILLVSTKRASSNIQGSP